MGKITTGDLVCMYRRKTKGMGIVLEKIDNMGERIGIDIDTNLAHLKTLRTYAQRRHFQTTCIAESNDPKMAKIFFAYNGQSWCRKRKLKFVRVRWFEAPSNYETASMSENDGWYPADWLKKL